MRTYLYNLFNFITSFTNVLSMFRLKKVVTIVFEIENLIY